VVRVHPRGLRVTTEKVYRWTCVVCGFVHDGAEPPDICPPCGADASQFDQGTLEDQTEAPLREKEWSCMVCGFIHSGATPPDLCPVCGADAVALGTASLIAIGCQQYRVCHTGKCPVGITTQDPELRKRFGVEESVKRFVNFCTATKNEVANIARITGRSDIHDLTTQTCSRSRMKCLQTQILNTLEMLDSASCACGDVDLDWHEHYNMKCFTPSS
jgi:rubredoxin